MKQSAARVWFITGCSKGFGRVFVETLAKAGDRVFATARDVDTLRELELDYPEQVRVAPLNIVDAGQIERAVATALSEFGQIDVLVNNAGFGVIGAIETISDRQTREIFDTNFFGTLNVTRAVLPSMRARRSGYIVQVSSSHAWGAGPGIGMYSASKCALEGASETMARELEPFGIRVTILQPGPYKTDFLGSGLKRAERDIDDYQAVTRHIADAVHDNHGKQPGDPIGVARAMLKIVDSDRPPLRLLLGKIATERAEQKLSASRAEIDAWYSVSIEADFAN